mmetsp:Transcript_22557/g.59928  ORF Transcript_22557/g.59928 Transcript_22557/m.59928 type:complete len:241 (-) Transcript_22557:99-821(-)
MRPTTIPRSLPALVPIPTTPSPLSSSEMFAFVSSLPVGRTSFATPLAVSAAPAPVARVSMMAEKSASVPFMDKPPALDGSMVGDVGFDPLNISSYLNIKWLREAELKHCRICMLAVLGLFAQELVQFPMYKGAPTLVTQSHDFFAKTGTLGQIAIWASFFEIMTTPAVLQMLAGSDRKPGEFCFDPLNFSKSPEAAKRYELNELKNGRLAMIAVGGIIHQQWLTNMGPIEQLTKGKFLPF